MSRAPDSIVAYYAKPVFTPSLRSQESPMVISIDQLRSATDLAPDRIASNEILQISSSTIVKAGWRVYMDEAETLILLAAKITVPVPRVISTYTIGEVGFILMTKIECEHLSSLESNISHEERESIAAQLKSYVAQWRKLKNCFVGSVNEGPCEDIIFKHPRDAMASVKQYGPFYSRDEYKIVFIEALRLSRPDGVWGTTEERLKDKILAFANTKSSTDDLGVMTHGDLHLGNIMIYNGAVSGIVDWGEAGFSLPQRESSLLPDAWPLNQVGLT
ncbi:hypothetical protein BDW59DRAFT_178788 [Aspergillus cavernicola]|uniref:Aminoglycoside phosphotransferase domain-containing protein n=1 Tax=Aspergillus cavernicola TaxID=176166 RepID=A0ABR4J2U9_9EURO